MNGNQMYSNIELSTDIMSADGHRLIQLMLNKLIQNTELAKTYVMSNEIIKRHEVIKKSIDIVDYLQLCLNHQDEKAKELSNLLDSLYAYMKQNFLEADMKNDISYLDETKKIILEIKTGWDGMSVNE